jgi:hypothetical protein
VNPVDEFGRCRANLEVPGTLHRVLREGGAAEQYDDGGNDSAA